MNCFKFSVWSGNSVGSLRRLNSKRNFSLPVSVSDVSSYFVNDNNGDSTINKRNDMKVIGLGLSRTNTRSLQSYFEKSGFAPSHHSVVMFETLVKTHDLTELNFWQTVVNQDMYNDDMKYQLNWDIAFNSKYNSKCQSSQELGVKYFKQLCHYYRDNENVKFILTVRDAESWFYSCRNSWLAVYFPRTSKQKERANECLKYVPYFAQFSSFMRNWACDTYGKNISFLDGENGNYQKQHCIDVFNRHNDNVEKFFNSNYQYRDRFIILDQSLPNDEKASKLNKFLNVDPSIALTTFPQMNSKDEFDAYVETAINTCKIAKANQ